MELTPGGTSAELLSNASKTSKALEVVRKQAEKSDDGSLREAVGRLWEEFLALRESIVSIAEENAGLRSRVAKQEAEKPSKPQIKTVGTTNYYYAGDAGPFCQPCYDLNGRLINLSPLQEYAGGMGRKCEVCNKVFFEGPSSRPRQRSITPGPWS
jgi:hypothetical protein